MRTITPAAQAFLDQKLGTELVFIIEVQWTEGGQRHAYADRQIGTIPGRILDIGGLDDVINVSADSTFRQISVVLDDTDGSIKGIIDAHDIHKRPCWIYQTFDGLDVADKVLLFRGQVSSPIEWGEGDRTIRFDGHTRANGNGPGARAIVIHRVFKLIRSTWNLRQRTAHERP